MAYLSCIQVWQKDKAEFLEEIVRKSGVPGYGLVLNNIKTKRWRTYGGGYGMRYGYGHGYGYGYGYGYGQGYIDDED